MSVPTLINMFMSNTLCAVHDRNKKVEEMGANMGAVPQRGDYDK